MAGSVVTGTQGGAHDGHEERDDEDGGDFGSDGVDDIMSKQQNVMLAFAASLPFLFTPAGTYLLSP